MYCLKMGKHVRGYVTAGEAWTDRNLQVRINRRVTPTEFKERLDSGETLKFHAMYVYLNGLPADEDIDAYLKSYDEKYRNLLLGFGGPPNAYKEAKLGNCFTVSQIRAALDEADIPPNDTTRALYLAKALGVSASLRFPEEYAETPRFEEIAQKLADINARIESAVGRNVNTDCAKTWEIIKMNDLENNEKTNPSRKIMLSHKYFIIAAYRGMSGLLELADEADKFIDTSTVLYTERAGDVFKLTTRNSIYHFKISK
ncbi:MAG: hypothetical protein LBI36_01445 [Oscillospiraceae bacterium]|jgi:hypothetical protein|nr:hypothetical protein [Oscillospiraceae bacterium]